MLTAFAEAQKIAHAGIARSAPAGFPSPLASATGDWLTSVTLSPEQISTAEEIVEMLLAFGDRTHGVLMRENVLDREIIGRLAHQLNTSGRTSEAIVGKVITDREISTGNINFELSRQTVKNRKTSWCGRVAKKLRATFPDIFGPSEIAHDLRRNGANLVDVANELMARGIAAPRGGKVWQATQVSRLLDQAA